MNSGLAKNIPLIDGDSDAPIERVILVMPEAAERSSSETNAMVYACLTGTSICEMQNLKINIAVAKIKFGIKGIKINRTLEGKCVKTIVLTSPNRFAIRSANNVDMPAARLTVKSILPSMPGFTLNLIKNQYAMMLCIINPPAKASNANNELNFMTVFFEW